MTTSVLITTHTWPVKVASVEKDLEGELEAVVATEIEPHSSHMVYVHQTRSLVIEELPERV